MNVVSIRRGDQAHVKAGSSPRTCGHPLRYTPAAASRPHAVERPGLSPPIRRRRTNLHDVTAAGRASNRIGTARGGPSASATRADSSRWPGNACIRRASPRSAPSAPTRHTAGAALPHASSTPSDAGIHDPRRDHVPARRRQYRRHPALRVARASDCAAPTGSCGCASPRNPHRLRSSPGPAAGYGSGAARARSISSMCSSAQARRAASGTSNDVPSGVSR